MTEFPRILLLAALVYLAASLGHFVHNAEFLDQYPNLPSWITRRGVYLAWVIVSLPGILAILAWARGRAGLALVLLAIWGASAYLGLDHYHLAPLSAHTAVANFSILFEVFAGSVLLVASLLYLVRLHSGRRNDIAA